MKLTISTFFVFGIYMLTLVALHPGVAEITPRMAFAADTPLGQAHYTIDPMHGNVYFEITHLGLSQVHGRFDKFEGHIVEDAAQLGNSSVELTAQTDSIDTAVEPRDNHLRTADFFDVATYPTLSFKSTGVEQHGDGYVLHGDLTMKGVTKPVSIPFKHHGPYVMQGKDKSVTRIGVVADPIVIKRSDFGVGKTDPMPDGTMGLSDEVIVRISFEATLDEPAATT
jgi:polyisoprenoid-binding protein YceI